jgi:hypothetical protein
LNSGGELYVIGCSRTSRAAPAPFPKMAPASPPRELGLCHLGGAAQFQARGCSPCQLCRLRFLCDRRRHGHGLVQASHVRFSPITRHRSGARACRRRPNSGLMRRSNYFNHLVVAAVCHWDESAARLPRVTTLTSMLELICRTIHLKLRDHYGLFICCSFCGRYGH